ncbi:hypothetical protein [Dactylosporangium sp. NPDC006015]|uniref:hypothetical protein n=1 Tax=Dactylosporangium sp. NPDC006015 TaxID=3154576 RepID=UPI0033AA8710
MHTAASTPNANYGYPFPGPQRPTGQDVMDNVFFVGAGDWERIRAQERFDHIVIGTGHCGLAFAEQVLQRRPEARILMLERGTFFLAEHFQNLPLPYEQTLGGLSETFPWTLSSRTVNGKHIRWQHGMVPFVGGRSIMWSAWCPRPTEAEMAGWPRPVIDVAHEYFRSAERLLNVVSAGDIDSGPTAPPPGLRPVFGALQHRLTDRLAEDLHRIPAATRVMPGPWRSARRSCTAWTSTSSPRPARCSASSTGSAGSPSRGTAARCTSSPTAPCGGSCHRTAGRPRSTPAAA